MKIAVAAFTLPKSGNLTSENDDAICFSFRPGEADQGLSEYGKASYLSSDNDGIAAFRCAVADGATESSYSGDWAQMLAKAYVKRNIGP